MMILPNHSSLIRKLHCGTFTYLQSILEVGQGCRVAKLVQHVSNFFDPASTACRALRGEWLSGEFLQPIWTTLWSEVRRDGLTWMVEIPGRQTQMEFKAASIHWGDICHSIVWNFLPGFLWQIYCIFWSQLVFWLLICLNKHCSVDEIWVEYPKWVWFMTTVILIKRT